MRGPYCSRSLPCGLNLVRGFTLAQVEVCAGCSKSRLPLTACSICALFFHAKRCGGAAKGPARVLWMPFICQSCRSFPDAYEGAKKARFVAPTSWDARTHAPVSAGGMTKLSTAWDLSAKLAAEVRTARLFFWRKLELSKKLEASSEGRDHAAYSRLLRDVLAKASAKAEVCRRLEQVAHFVLGAEDPEAADREVSPKWGALAALAHDTSLDASGIVAALSGGSVGASAWAEAARLTFPPALCCGRRSVSHPPGV